MVLPKFCSKTVILAYHPHFEDSTTATSSPKSGINRKPSPFLLITRINSDLTEEHLHGRKFIINSVSCTIEKSPFKCFVAFFEKKFKLILEQF